MKSGEEKKYILVDGEKVRYLGDSTPEYYRNGGNGRNKKFGKKMKSKKRYQ